MVQGLTQEMAIQRKMLDRLTALVDHPLQELKENSGMARDRKQRKQQ